MLVKLLHLKQFTALKTATSSRSFGILLSDSWWEMCSSGNRTRLVRPGGNYRSIDTKISELPTGIFGWMERALDINAEVLKTCCWCSSPSCNRSWSVLPFRSFFGDWNFFWRPFHNWRSPKGDFLKKWASMERWIINWTDSSQQKRFQNKKVDLGCSWIKT